MNRRYAISNGDLGCGKRYSIWVDDFGEPEKIGANFERAGYLTPAQARVAAAEAAITRGFWRWKRCTLVKLVPAPVTWDPSNKAWVHVASQRKVDFDIETALQDASKKAAKREQHDLDWKPVGALPEARTVR
jgi:hypothetical protein